MAEQNVYKRKVSAEEVQEGFIFILKDYVKFFPKPKIPFKLKVNEEEYEVQVNVVERWSTGPNKPQVQYRIPIRKFQGKFPVHRNSIVKFTKLEDGVYSLSK